MPANGDREAAVIGSKPEDAVSLMVDWLFRDLDAYEAALYVYLFRKTLHVGEPTFRIGKRSLSAEFVRGARGGGDGNRGGLTVNYQHLSQALKSLEKKGCIRSGDTTRDGTLYSVVDPRGVPSVAARLRINSGGPTEVADYFTDPLKRREIFEREHWNCAYCGERLTPETATLDHFIPQSKGGDHRKENLRASCLMCNSIKSGRTYEEVAVLLLQSVAERRAKLA
jgi:HNH endonuclease